MSDYYIYELSSGDPLQAMPASISLHATLEAARIALRKLIDNTLPYKQAEGWGIVNETHNRTDIGDEHRWLLMRNGDTYRIVLRITQRVVHV